MKSFQKIQLDFTAYLRKPKISKNSFQQGDRRKEIYRDLVYKNISQCIANSFPITHRIMTDHDWREMIGDFIAVHESHTPYFLEMSQEFLSYLINERQPAKSDNPFMLELAHFEWIQLSIATADATCSENQLQGPVTENFLWKISPLVIGLTYFYPVHIIDQLEDYELQANTQRTYLLVYRNRADDLMIVETDSLRLRIVQLLQSNEILSGLELFNQLVVEFGDQKNTLSLNQVVDILKELSDSDIIYN